MNISVNSTDANNIAFLVSCFEMLTTVPWTAGSRSCLSAHQSYVQTHASFFVVLAQGDRGSDYPMSCPCVCLCDVDLLRLNTRARSLWDRGTRPNIWTGGQWALSLSVAPLIWGVKSSQITISVPFNHKEVFFNWYWLFIYFMTFYFTNRVFYLNVDNEALVSGGLSSKPPTRALPLDSTVGHPSPRPPAMSLPTMETDQGLCLNRSSCCLVWGLPPRQLGDLLLRI